jgi:hypothetical protein
VSQSTLPVKEALSNSRTGSLVSSIVTRSHRVIERFFELDRVLLVRCDSHLGSAIDDASDRLLHSETTETRVPVASSYPGAAVHTHAPFGKHPWMLSFRSFRLVLTHTASRRMSISRPKTRGRAPRGSGPLDASETGEDRVSRRDPHFGDPFDSCVRLFSSTHRPSDPPLTSLSPPP